MCGKRHYCLTSIAGNPSKVAKSAAVSSPASSKGRQNRDRKEASIEAAENGLPPKKIVCVDFGTTHSGVAMVDSVNCGIGDVEVLRNWVDGARSNEFFQKVPSRIAYPSENPGLEKITFGYEVTSEMKSSTWMKLLLMVTFEKDDFSNPHVGGKAGHGMLELPPGKTAQDVIVDYLRCVYDHLMDHISEETSALMMKDRPIEFWLPTPPCWNDAENARMLESAKRAGFGSRPLDKVCMMGEAEAVLNANVSTSVDRNEGIYEVCCLH